MDPLGVLLITYMRTEYAIRTIRGLQKLAYPAEDLYFHIADDGSGFQHVKVLLDAIHEFCPNKVTISDAKRSGVGKSMNLGQQALFSKLDLVLWLEDDWELVHEYDIKPAIELLKTDSDIGMIRLGYISPGIKGELIKGADRLWWKLEKSLTYTYTFSGHASLRHKRFYEAYGKYSTVLAPGATELNMCGVFNSTKGPTVAIPVDGGAWGHFAHIGTESFKDVIPQ
jgi:hypothetical protein